MDVVVTNFKISCDVTVEIQWQVSERRFIHYLICRNGSFEIFISLPITILDSRQQHEIKLHWNLVLYFTTE